MTDLETIRPVLRALLAWCDTRGPLICPTGPADRRLLRATDAALPTLRRLAAAPAESCEGCAMYEPPTQGKCELGHGPRRCCEYAAGQEVPRG